MDRESVERLRFDRRLQRRNGWLAPGEALANIEALPDVSDKMTTAAELEAEEAAAAEAEEAAAEAAPAPAPPPTFGSPAPVAGDFSSSASSYSPPSHASGTPGADAADSSPASGGFGGDSGGHRES